MIVFMYFLAHRTSAYG